jgi:hypothetical protein
MFFGSSIDNILNLFAIADKDSGTAVPSDFDCVGVKYAVQAGRRTFRTSWSVRMKWRCCASCRSLSAPLRGSV